MKTENGSQAEVGDWMREGGMVSLGKVEKKKKYTV